MENSEQIDFYKHITNEVVKLIIFKHGLAEQKVANYSVCNASDKMLGFLCDYWRLEVNLTPSKKVLHYFLKVVSVINKAKAETVKDLKLIEKEIFFYEVIRENIEISGLKPWSAGFVMGLKEFIVFEDMDAQNYKHRNKFQRFDMSHTLEALKTLARLHSSSIVFEEKKRKEIGCHYSLNDDFSEYLGKAGYEMTDPWYVQCMYGALEAIKKFSKYKDIENLEERWKAIWSSALTLADPSGQHRNVICHRDLWNNNIMFHYKDSEEVPDDCILVDFQAVRYQPPAGDVMLLLYCNLEPSFREIHMEKFVNFYLDEVHTILNDNGVNPVVISRSSFMQSVEEQRLWGIVICACLMPLSWIDDDETITYFGDTEQFDYIVTKDKGSFIINMMQTKSDYKSHVLALFDEIIERYLLSGNMFKS